jgi:hypothetical protein
MCDTIRRRLTGVNQSRREDNTTKQQTSRGERRECVYYTDVEESRDRRGQLTRREGDDRWMRQGRGATRRDTRTSRDYETSGQRQQEPTGKGKNTKVKLKQSKSSCNMVDGYSDVESDDSVDSGEPINLNVPHNFCRMLGKVSTGTDKMLYKVKVIINGKCITMAIDTCSDLSLITIDEYKTQFPDVQLLKTNQKIKTYGGHNFKLLGKIIVNPVIDGQQYSSLTLYVADVDTKQPAPLGCDWLKVVKVNWAQFRNTTNEKVCALNVGRNEVMFKKETHDNIVDLIKTDYSELISKGVGLIKNHEASINIKGGVPCLPLSLFRTIGVKASCRT